MTGSGFFLRLGSIVRSILGGVVLDIHLSLPYLMGAAIMLTTLFASLSWVTPGLVSQKLSEYRQS